jgi:hypothetical protein
MDNAIDETRVALAAGYDTTAHTLAWALWHLADAPGWRRREHPRRGAGRNPPALPRRLARQPNRPHPFSVGRRACLAHTRHGAMLTAALGPFCDMPHAHVSGTFL